MVASAARVPHSASRSATRSPTPAPIGSTGSGMPLSPVEQTRTSSRRHPGEAGTRSHVRSPTCTPAAPVAALVFLLLRTTAAPGRKCRRDGGGSPARERQPGCREDGGGGHRAAVKRSTARPPARPPARPTEFGRPVRYRWAEDYRGDAMVVYGHTPVPEATWLNRTICIDLLPDRSAPRATMLDGSRGGSTDRRVAPLLRLRSRDPVGPPDQGGRARPAPGRRPQVPNPPEGHTPAGVEPGVERRAMGAFQPRQDVHPGQQSRLRVEVLA